MRMLILMGVVTAASIRGEPPRPVLHVQADAVAI